MRVCLSWYLWTRGVRSVRYRSATSVVFFCFFFFFQAEDGIRDYRVTGVQTCALPICTRLNSSHTIISYDWSSDVCRSEEHTSELQSHDNIVCRLLLEKKK